MNNYMAIYNATAQANTDMGIKASEIASQTIKTGRPNGIHYLKVGNVVVGYCNDKASLVANHNRACSVARQQTKHLKNGMSYGVPNGVSQVYSNFDGFVGLESIGFASPAYKSAYARKLNGQYYFLIGQGVSNNFHEIVSGYEITHNLEEKREIHRA